jgi:tRNA (adenine57-N1/adenine58-N1)-methyltransferase catalytic subunit
MPLSSRSIETKQRLASFMDNDAWAVLVEPEGKVHVVEMQPGVRKVKGLGVFDPIEAIGKAAYGATITVGQKKLTRMPPRLPELSKGMLRRAQTISAKDAGYLIARMGLGSGDRVLEAGLGSAGLSMHIARSLGGSGLHVTVEPRTEHAEVGLKNMIRAKQSWAEFPEHHHVEGAIEEVTDAIQTHAESFDAIILDLPNHTPAVGAVAPLLAVGGRLACYCPVTSQVEAAWFACEEAGLEVEWAGELIERQWGKASKGGMRPVNGPFGHTAFLLIAQRISVDELTQ